MNERHSNKKILGESLFDYKIHSVPSFKFLNNKMKKIKPIHADPNCSLSFEK
jgi:hypothetical protein